MFLSRKIRSDWPVSPMVFNSYLRWQFPIVIDRGDSALPSKIGTIGLHPSEIASSAVPI